MEKQEIIYPTGKKFFEVSKPKSQEYFASALTLETYKAFEHVKSHLKVGNDYVSSGNLGYWLSNIIEVTPTDTDFPIFTIKGCEFFRIGGLEFSATVSYKKNHHASSYRYKGIENMPYFKGMQVQWDNVRKGFIVHNMPYEGDMETIKGSGISKKITELMKEMSSEIGMFELLGENTYTSGGERYSGKAGQNERAKQIFEKYIEGKHTSDDMKSIVQIIGVYNSHYCSERATELQQLARNNQVDSNERYNYYQLRPTGNKPKITPNLRAHLLATYGGIKVPDNYQEWFDG